MELYYFDINGREVSKESLPRAVLDHCKKKESFLAAEALINMGVENLHYNEKKKPVADNCFVSISHSENMVAVCKSHRPVGIDIEKINEKRNLSKIAERFYEGKELELFRAEPTAEVFYEIWTKKEAYSKISGEGIGEVFEGFDLYSLSEYTFETKKIDGFMMSVCEKI